MSKQEIQQYAEAYLEQINGYAESDEHLLCEMATIGWPTIDGIEYKMSIHGVNTRDRPIPHIHLDRADDLNRTKFSFEISLVDMLATGEPVLVRQKDFFKGKHIDAKNKSDCSWNGYSRLYNGVVNYLNSAPEDENAPKNARTNLESFVINWNRESGPKPHALDEYLAKHNIDVLDRYKSYFPMLYPNAKV